jgi:hypothetical protein
VECKKSYHRTEEERVIGMKNEEYYVFLRSVRRLLVTVNVLSLLILVILMMEALSSSETFFLTRSTWSNSPGDEILHSLRSENLKSYRIIEILTRYLLKYGSRKLRLTTVWDPPR